MHPYVTEMCTHVHSSVTEWCVVGYGNSVLCDVMWLQAGCQIINKLGFEENGQYLVMMTKLRDVIWRQ